MAMKHYEPKEFIWTLDLDGEDKIFKCLITDTECITYEGDREHKHLKIMNPLRKNKVLQIDTVTSIYGMQIPIQVENGIPYIKMEGRWIMSDTNRADRIARAKKVNTITSGLQIAFGLFVVALSFFWGPLGAESNKNWMFPVLGAVLIISGLMGFSRLKTELDAIKEADAMAEQEKAERRAAAKRAE